ncbi:MAG: IclR family transcriptional regulator [Burkholderiaceae bacterium]
MDDGSVKGTQSIARAIALIKAICQRPINGWCLADLVAYCGLEDGTARRVLKKLVLERLLARRACDGRYVPGPLLYELGMTAFPYAQFQSACEPYLGRLGRRFDSAAFLYLRSGDEFVCIGLRNPLSLKGVVLQVGTRRSLGLASGGMAIILGLEEPERSRMLRTCEKVARKQGKKALATFQNIHARSEAFGAGVNLNDGLGGVAAVCAALFLAPGEPFASIGVGNAADHIAMLGVERVKEAVEQEARAIERDLAGLIAAFRQVEPGAGLQC